MRFRCGIFGRLAVRSQQIDRGPAQLQSVKDSREDFDDRPDRSRRLRTCGVLLAFRRPRRGAGCSRHRNLHRRKDHGAAHQLPAEQCRFPAEDDCKTRRRPSAEARRRQSADRGAEGRPSPPCRRPSTICRPRRRRRPRSRRRSRRRRRPRMRRRRRRGRSKGRGFSVMAGRNAPGRRRQRGLRDARSPRGRRSNDCQTRRARERS